MTVFSLLCCVLILHSFLRWIIAALLRKTLGASKDFSDTAVITVGEKQLK